MSETRLVHESDLTFIGYGVEELLVTGVWFLCASKDWLSLENAKKYKQTLIEESEEEDPRPQFRIVRYLRYKEIVDEAQ